jgi:hypothetical protein
MLAKPATPKVSVEGPEGMSAMPYPRPLQPSRRVFLAASTLAALPAAALTTGAVGARAVTSSNVILTWHDITNQAVTAASFAEPITQSRAWAVSWLAAARAARHGSGDPGYTNAAIAQALHDALAIVVPAQRAQLDATLAATLASVPDGTHKRKGIAAGRAEAAKALAERAGDGTDTASVDVAFTPPPAAPGVWQPTPPAFGPAVRAGQGNARPFLLTRNDQFDPGPPPALRSRTYERDVAEVRAIGAATSGRTSEQTDIALFWYPGLNPFYVAVLRAVLAVTRRPVWWQARFVAAFHIIQTDAQITIYNAKYRYLRWRPVTAIRTGNVHPDPSWTPLSVTPSHPEYPSGHGGQAGAAQKTLAAFLGPYAPVPISLTSSNAPGVTRTYADWQTITDEIIDARVWEGVHFRNSDITAVRQGLTVAAYDLRNLGRLGI